MIAQRLTGDRLHLHHGPIDVVLRAWGMARDVAAAERAAVARFDGLLEALVGELPELRRDVADGPVLQGVVARRMLAACMPFAARGMFVTSMAAVAGAVADELLSAMRGAAPGLRKAFVNDGGDIAVFCAQGESLVVGMMGDGAMPPPQPSPASAGEGVRARHSSLPCASGGGLGWGHRNGGREALWPNETYECRSASRGASFGTLRITAADGIGGVATSGRHGRSFSLGIADAVTVLAPDAASADAAATLIANAVNIDSAAVTRAPARSLDPDSDLGDRLVTVRVGALTAREIATALDTGAARADAFWRAGLIRGAALLLAGETRVAGAPFVLQRAA